MSTITEIKAAAGRLPLRQKRALARWLQSQANDRPTDADLMAAAAAGARALDRREAAYAKRQAR